MATILKDKIQIARKDHQCDWCGRKIHKGKEYKYTACMVDGDFQATKFHPKCEDELFQAVLLFDIQEEDQVQIYEIRGMWLDPAMREQDQ
jgi:hypothetical protein